MILSLLINVLEIRSNRRLFVSITVRGNALLITWITRRPFQITREMYQLWWRYTHSSGGDACHGTPMVDTWCIPGGGESGWMPQVINRQPSLAWSTYLHARTATNKQRLTNSGFELIGSTQPELLVGGKTRKTDLSKCAKVYIFS